VNVTIYPGRPSGVNFEAASVVKNLAGATVLYCDTEDPFITEGSIAVGASATLTGTYFFVASATTLLSYTDLGPDVDTQIGTLGQRIGDEEEAREVADAALDARAATLEGDSPLGSVVYAQKYLALVPGTYANATLAIEAAMAATPALGGTVILPPGVIDGVGELTYPAKKIKVQGAGEDATYYRTLADTGAGTFAVAMTNNVEHELEDLTVQGPTAAVLNGTSASMDGVRHYGRNRINRVRVQNFSSGIGCAGDHSRISYTRFSGCKRNIRYLGQAATGLATWGNNTLDHVDLTGATLAGIAFAPDGHANGATWQDVHFGMAPVGMLFEVDGSNNAASVQDITQVGCTYENCGNAFVYSMSTTQAGILAMTMVGCVGSQVFRSGFVDTSLARNQRAHYDGLYSVSLTLQDSPLMVAVGAGPLPLNVQYGGYQAIEVNDGGSVALESLIAQGARMLANPLGFPLGSTRFRERAFLREAETHYCDGVGIIAGRLVYRSADGGVKPWVAGRAVYGVALQSGASLDFIAVGRKGIWNVANSATSALAIGDDVIPDSATADGKLTKAGAGPGAVIGTAMAVAGTSTTARVDFTPSGWRF
jgi:hypothetical protein